MNFFKKSTDYVKFLIKENKKENYFKRIKKPVNNPQEAKPILKETRTYFFTALILSIILLAPSSLIPVVGTVFMIIGGILFFVAIAFGFILYAMRRSLKKIKNLTCDKCGAKLDSLENISYKELSRNMLYREGSADQARFYVNVQFRCKCPNCGAEKTFVERLCSGYITVTDNSIDDKIITTDQLVKDYINGIIHV